MNEDVNGSAEEIPRVTVRQVLKIWRSDIDGEARVAVRRLRYRAVGGDWGHSGGQGKRVLRIREPGMDLNECALAAACVSLRAAGPEDEIYLVLPEGVADLAQAVIRGEAADLLAASAGAHIAPVLDVLTRATVEIRSRPAFRDLAKFVSRERDAGDFISLAQAEKAIDAAIAGNTRPVSDRFGDCGWMVDWGRSMKYGGAAVGICPVPWQGVEEVRVMEVPQKPDINNGELAAVLLAYAYLRRRGNHPKVIYSDARDIGENLRTFIQQGRPGRYGTLLPRVAAPFTDEELLALEVRWAYRGLSREQRMADLAARRVSRGEPVPPGARVDLTRLLDDPESYGRSTG